MGDGGRDVDARASFWLFVRPMGWKGRRQPHRAKARGVRAPGVGVAIRIGVGAGRSACSTPAGHPASAATDADLRHGHKHHDELAKDRALHGPSIPSVTSRGRAVVAGPARGGGMGVVYAALKLIRPGLMSEATRRRFAREAAAFGRLRHPDIARIYAGETEIEGASIPYLAMEPVSGAVVPAARAGWAPLAVTGDGATARTPSRGPADSSAAGRRRWRS
jgi:hypothetical protein